MARGDTPEGRVRDTSSSRLICSGPDIGVPGDETSDTSNFHPNCLAFGIGNQPGANPEGPNTDSVVTYATTLDDYTIEMWIKRNYPDSITNWQTAAAAAAGYGFTGLMEDDDGQRGAGVWFRGANFEAIYRPTSPWTGGAAITCVLPFGWCHVAVTYDRDGNMEAFVNGVSQGTAAISSDNIAMAAALVVCDADAADAASGKIHPPYSLAAFAVHAGTAGSGNGLLTAAQIQDSVDNFTLQDIASVTGDRIFINNTVVMPNFTSDDSLTAAATGTWSLVSVYEPPATGFTRVPNTITMANIMAEYPHPARMAQETLYETIYDGAGSGSKPVGVRTLGIGGRTTTKGYIEWNLNYDDESTTVWSVTGVLADDPDWPPQPTGGTRGYA